MASLKKNTASQNITFCMATTAGAADAAATVSVFVVKDNGAQAAGSGSVTNSGNGQYNYAPTQAETNATDVGFLFTATGDVPVNYDFHTDICGASSGLPEVDMEAINDSTLAAQALNNSTNSIPWGTCTTGSTASTVNVGTLNNPGTITDVSQLQGRIIIFLGSTTTAGLQAQAALITTSTTGATPAISLSAPLTRAPATGDKFVII